AEFVARLALHGVHRRAGDPEDRGGHRVIPRLAFPEDLALGAEGVEGEHQIAPLGYGSLRAIRSTDRATACSDSFSASRCRATRPQALRTTFVVEGSWYTSHRRNTVRLLQRRSF